MTPQATLTVFVIDDDARVRANDGAALEAMCCTLRWPQCWVTESLPHGVIELEQDDGWLFLPDSQPLTVRIADEWRVVAEVCGDGKDFSRAVDAGPHRRDALADRAKNDLNESAIMHNESPGILSIDDEPLRCNTKRGAKTISSRWFGTFQNERLDEVALLLLH